jgi:RNA polymerase sigma factor (sigma-70 family)
MQLAEQKSKDNAVFPLTDEQAHLVRENIGLVGVHLRRHVANLSQPRRDREWEDLFQEGCLGLIDAARRFRVDRGIPFAAFAFPRIHNAVSKALSTKFATVYVPPRRTSGGCTGAPGRNSESGFGDCGETPDPRPMADARPSVRSLSEMDERNCCYRGRHHTETACSDTIGSRLREKYECAVRTAAETSAGKTSTRGDRDALVHLLKEERFLIPSAESRRSLRQIARDTQSSYARVAQCDKQMGDRIRLTLDADPEFGELRRRKRAAPLGGDVPIDAEIERGLVLACADEFVRRFGDADEKTRAGVLHTVLEVSNSDIKGIVRQRFATLPRSTQVRLLEETASTASPRSRPGRASSQCRERAENRHSPIS